MAPADVAEMVQAVSEAAAGEHEARTRASSARKPEAELTLADHEPKPLGRNACTAGVHGKTFRVGDKVTAVDRFGQVVTGFVTGFEYMDTKVNRLAEVTYRKAVAYYAVVEYEKAANGCSMSVMLDVRKLERAHPELPVGRR